MIPIVTAAQMQALDRRTIDEARVPGITLMERAGAGVVAVHPVIVLAHAYGFDVGDAARHIESRPVDPEAPAP